MRDAVNVASRIQSLNTQCGFPVIITRATWERIRENCQAAKITATPCGEFPIRGRSAAIEVYGLGEPIPVIENHAFDENANDELWLKARQLGALGED